MVFILLYNRKYGILITIKVTFNVVEVSPVLMHVVTAINKRLLKKLINRLFLFLSRTHKTLNLFLHHNDTITLHSHWRLLLINLHHPKKKQHVTVSLIKYFLNLFSLCDSRNTHRCE